MSYVEDNLMSNERVLFSAKISPAIFLRPVFAFVIFLVFFFKALQLTSTTDQFSQIIGSLILFGSFAVFCIVIYLIIAAIVIMKTSEFAVTSRRVISKTGFIRRNITEILLTKIESVGVKQNILGRILGFGTIKITGTGGTHQKVSAITDPLTTRKKINQVLGVLHSRKKPQS